LIPSVQRTRLISLSVAFSARSTNESMMTSRGRVITSSL
jgi:hypothetical protein